MTKVWLGNMELGRFNQKGSSALAAIAMIGVFLVLPGLLVSANSSYFDSSNRMQMLERIDLQAESFTLATFGSLRSTFSCTENLKSAGLHLTPALSLNSSPFPLKLLRDDGTLGLRSELITAPSSLGHILKDIELVDSQIQYLSSRSPSTALARLSLRFKSKDPTLSPASTYEKSYFLNVLLETDSSQKVLRCVLTKAVDTTGRLLEDKVCQTLNGPTSKYELKNEICT